MSVRFRIFDCRSPAEGSRLPPASKSYLSYYEHDDEWRGLDDGDVIEY